MLPPKPVMGSMRRRGVSNSTDSLPRTQRGTITGSPRTFSSPSRSISAKIQSSADSRLDEPLNRGPKVSTSNDKRS